MAIMTHEERLALWGVSRLRWSNSGFKIETFEAYPKDMNPSMRARYRDLCEKGLYEVLEEEFGSPEDVGRCTCPDTSNDRRCSAIKHEQF